MPEKHSISITGHRTSVSLEPEFWDELGAIARERRISVGRLISEIDAGESGGALSGRIRVFVLNHLKRRKD